VFVDSEEVEASTCAALAANLKLDVERFSADIAGVVVDERVTSCARGAVERGAFGGRILIAHIRLVTRRLARYCYVE
jgi:hypothetical protein